MYRVCLCIFMEFTVGNRRKNSFAMEMIGCFPENKSFRTTLGDWALLVELY